MYSLAISSSGKYISVALHDDFLVASSTVLAKNGTTNLLMQNIDELTKKSDIKRDQIELVYLDIGPGFFTSLRIGLAVAQGICGSLGIPLIPVNGLDALAFSAHTSHRQIYTVIDIKRDEYAFCIYKPVPGGVVRELEPIVVNLESLLDRFNEDNQKKLLVGNWRNIDQKYFNKNSYIKTASPEFVSSEHIYQLGKELYKKREFTNFNEIELFYMREPDVSLSINSLTKEVNFYD
jgi:tRNA threonylcarbamoyladenosine biosynthesis protein TsaB